MAEGPQDTEYLLARITQHRVTFKDQEDVRRTDDFDVSLVLSYDSFGQGLGQQASKLRLKYFVIMTSRRELYPMDRTDATLGKFRPVSTSHSLMQRLATTRCPPSRPPPSAPGTPESGEPPSR